MIDSPTARAAHKATAHDHLASAPGAHPGKVRRDQSVPIFQISPLDQMLPSDERAYGDIMRQVSTVHAGPALPKAVPKRKAQPEARSPWEDLPVEIWLKIYFHLDPGMEPTARGCPFWDGHPDVYSLARSFAGPCAAFFDSTSAAQAHTYAQFMWEILYIEQNRSRTSRTLYDYYLYLNQPWSPKRLPFIGSITCAPEIFSRSKEYELTEAYRMKALCNPEAALSEIAKIDGHWSKQTWARTVDLLTYRRAPLTEIRLYYYVSLGPDLFSRLESFSSLTSVSLDGCVLGVTELSELGRLKQLNSLCISCCPWLNNDNLKKLWGLKNLTRLNLEGANADEGGLELIQHLPKLRVFKCDNWLFSDPKGLISQVLPHRSMLWFTSDAFTMHYRSRSTDYVESIEITRKKKSKLSLWYVVLASVERYTYPNADPRRRIFGPPCTEVSIESLGLTDPSASDAQYRTTG